MTGIAERPTITRETRTPSSRQLAAMRKQLDFDREQTLRMIEQLDRELVDFVSARNDAPTDDEHDPEGPTLAFERSQASAMLRQSRHHLSDIETALARMDAGTYGFCIRCGEPIALGRLQVRPQSAECISCAERFG